MISLVLAILLSRRRRRARRRRADAARRHDRRRPRRRAWDAERIVARRSTDGAHDVLRERAARRAIWPRDDADADAPAAMSVELVDGTRIRDHGVHGQRPRRATIETPYAERPLRISDGSEFAASNLQAATEAAAARVAAARRARTRRRRAAGAPTATAPSSTTSPASSAT